MFTSRSRMLSLELVFHKGHEFNPYPRIVINDIQCMREMCLSLKSVGRSSTGSYLGNVVVLFLPQQTNLEEPSYSQEMIVGW